MSGCDLFNENYYSTCSNKMDCGEFAKHRSSRRSLKLKFDRESSFGTPNEGSSQLSRSAGSWCDALSLSISNVNAKQAWKSGTEKISQTINNVRTTFGSLSQKIKRSTRRRQPLINLESPRTPGTPYTRSKALLGRTPTKLYSPFYIETPNGKENLNRCAKKLYTSKGHMHSSKKNLRQCKITSPKRNNTCSSFATEIKLSNDLLQTQLGIYEFHTVASKIVQSNSK